MRIAAIILALTLTACGAPPAAEAPQDASAGSTGVGRVADEPFTLESEALIGLWSFDRTCGLYDLVFDADDLVQYYDYTDPTVVSYRGSWSIAENNRVVLNVTRLDMNDEPMGEVHAFHVDVGAPVTDDLIGAFGPAGGPARDITALRCPDEDRE
jgi:hypothetical protein